VPKEVQDVLAKHLNASAKQQRDDIVKANLDLQKDLEGKGLTFNTTDTEAFQKALRGTKFYPQAKEKFGNEAWALIEKYVGALS